ncbi:MAG TPA: pyruvate kinase, partial [Candidatus Goldiibacteriota bacterium]|nr:pyruvate kinase [Candidatus Goldiibacteriota bacterium]
EALKRLGRIIDACDGIMAARGDLAVEAGYRAVPAAQKKMVAMANDRGKLVIVATQMLESMINSPFPQRAEITDVYNAVSDGADLLMLSAETSMGKYPERTVRVMSDIIHEAEKKEKGRSCAVSRVTKGHEMENALSKAAVEAACVLRKAAIAVMVRKKEDISYMSDYRPENGIIAVVDNGAMLRKMCAYHGVRPVLSGPARIAKTLKRACKKAENIIIVDYGGAEGGRLTVKAPAF